MNSHDELAARVTDLEDWADQKAALWQQTFTEHVGIATANQVILMTLLRQLLRMAEDPAALLSQIQDEAAVTLRDSVNFTGVHPETAEARKAAAVEHLSETLGGFGLVASSSADGRSPS